MDVRFCDGRTCRLWDLVRALADANDETEIQRRCSEAIGRPAERGEAMAAYRVARAAQHKAAQQFEGIAEIGAWLHIDATECTPAARIGLHANIPRIQAQQVLLSGAMDPTDYESAYELTLLATGDAQQALRARARAMEALVDARTGQGG